MRFFTMDWWHAVQNGKPPDPFQAYATHLERLRGRLLECQRETLAALESIAIHDAVLRILNVDSDSQTLTLGLDESEAGDRLVLRYFGVRRFEINSNPEVGFPCPNGFGDLGYWEIDMEANGAFVHRILFSSAIEFDICFEKFQSSKGETPVESPK